MSFQSERRSWQAEVDAEAERLVRAGVPPYDAVQQAAEIVSRRRHADAIRGAQDAAMRPK